MEQFNLEGLLVLLLIKSFSVFRIEINDQALIRSRIKRYFIRSNKAGRYLLTMLCFEAAIPYKPRTDNDND